MSSYCFEYSITQSLQKSSFSFSYKVNKMPIMTKENKEHINVTFVACITSQMMILDNYCVNKYINPNTAKRINETIAKCKKKYLIFQIPSRLTSNLHFKNFKK